MNCPYSTGTPMTEERFLLDFFMGSMSVTTKDKDPDTPSLQG
jgi:hypothetical protein